MDVVDEIVVIALEPAEVRVDRFRRYAVALRPAVTTDLAPLDETPKEWEWTAREVESEDGRPQGRDTNVVSIPTARRDSVAVVDIGELD